MTNARTKVIVVALLAATFLGCGSSESFTVEIEPETAQVVAGQTRRFDATQIIETSNSIDITGDNSLFNWSVVEPNGGSVSANGEYTAPLSPGVFHVKATSKERSDESATATVTVVAP